MFGCEYCHRIDGHHSSCPNYQPFKAKYHCDICGKGIQSGEEYITNDNGDCAHWECFNGIMDLAEFLNCEIKEMEDEY